MNVYMEALQNIYEKIKNEKPAATIITGDIIPGLHFSGKTILKTGKDVYLVIFYCRTIWRNLSMNLPIFVMMVPKLV